MDDDKIYYVYAWIRNDKDEMFYIGKGHGNRYKDLSMRNKHFLNIVNKIGKDNCRIIFLEENLTEQEAFDREKYYISYYRKLGVELTNICDGGEGSSGWFDNISEEEKQRHREVSKSFLGKKHTEETKRKMSLSATGRHILTEDSKRRIAESKKLPVVVFYKNAYFKEFDSIFSCKEYFNVSKDLIRNALKHDGEVQSNYKKHLFLKEYRFYYKDK